MLPLIDLAPAFVAGAAVEDGGSLGDQTLVELLEPSVSVLVGLTGGGDDQAPFKPHEEVWLYWPTSWASEPP